MKTLKQGYAKLRRQNLHNYVLISVCSFLSVLLISSFSIVMQSGTIQTMLPEGGDSRSQMTMIFMLAVVGCAIFSTYAASLFFRSKSRELGIFMALGAKKKQLKKLLRADLTLIAVVTSVAGIVLGLPLAAGIWKIFESMIPTAEMAFVPSLSGFIWPIAFSLFTTLVLFNSGRRFVKRSNIIDVVNEAKKSEPVRDVKAWFGTLGIILMVLGGVLPTVLLRLYAANDYVVPFWVNLLYILLLVGLYMFLLFIVVRGFGGKQTYYRNIITRSLMKFQGKQTVLNMCVVTILALGAYFALFYAPLGLAGNTVAFSGKPVDFAFHYRDIETGMITQAEIEQMAHEEGISMSGYTEAPMVNLATDGYVREPQADGTLGRDYYEFHEDEMFLSESAYNQISGQNVDVLPGRYVFITEPEYSQNIFDYLTEMTRFTNPDTMQVLSVQYQDEVVFSPMFYYFILDDADYAAITEGLSQELRETWVQFNVDDVDGSYPFATRLYNAIIDASSDESSIPNNYDFVERMLAHEAGNEYKGDTVAQMQLDFSMRESSDFQRDWRYMPQFKVMEKNDFWINFAVFIMLFIFIAIICFAAITVIVYTRCLTIAMNNRQVYSNLRQLGAGSDYLFASLRGQVSKIFMIPLTIGTVGILLYYTMLMYANTGSFSASEFMALGIDIGLVALVSALMYGIYRFTLGKVCRMLEVHDPGK